MMDYVFQFVNLHSTIVDNSFFSLPFTEIKQNNSSVTGNLGLSYLPQKDVKTGFIPIIRLPFS
jgi:hypothetical protein